MKINIATINLQSGVATTKGSFHYALTGWKYWLPHSDKPIETAGNILQEEDVGIACVTEISEKSLCTGFRSQTTILGESAGMSHRHFFSTKIPFSALRDEGNAIISKYPIASSTSHPLHKELFNASIDEVVIEVDGKRIAVFVVHLALTQKHRQIQVKEIIGLIKDRKGPMILAGDFNERNPSALDILLQETPLKHKCTLKTYPSWNQKYPLDYIFLGKEFNILDFYIPKSPLFSDHAALVVKVEFD